MNIGRKKDISCNQYVLGTTLERIHLEKDIGGYIDDELKFEEHMGEKVKKATQVFAVIRRSFHHLNKNFIPLYKSLVRTLCKFDLDILDYEISGTDRGSAKRDHQTNTRDEGLIMCQKTSGAKVINFKL